MNEERPRLFLSDTESSPPPAHAPAPDLLLMKSGEMNKDIHCFTVCFRGANMAYISKTRMGEKPVSRPDT